jgi:rubredoxin
MNTSATKTVRVYTCFSCGLEKFEVKDRGRMKKPWYAYGGRWVQSLRCPKCGTVLDPEKSVRTFYRKGETDYSVRDKNTCPKCEAMVVHTGLVKHSVAKKFIDEVAT